MPLPASVSSALSSLATATPRALKAYAYGTSGFRGPSTTLDAVCMRMGVLAALRSWAILLARGEAAAGPSLSAASAPPAATVCPIIGLVVTASHNAGVDNGVKLVDASGEMMVQSWEAVATELANASEEQFVHTVEQILERFGLVGAAEASFDKSGPPPRVFVARDTRTSSPKLNALVLAGARAMGAEVHDFGLATTPQLHWLVREANEGRTATIEAYYKQLDSSFRKALLYRPANDKVAASSSSSAAAASSSSASSSASSPSTPPLLSATTVDCANGVGTHSIAALAPYLADVLPLHARNTNVDDMAGLNENCGAEHVQKGRSGETSTLGTPQITAYLP
jgi:phosphoacetylglucosamine mutase